MSTDGLIRCVCLDEWGHQTPTAICGEFRLGPATPTGDEEGVCTDCGHAPECHEDGGRS